MKNDRALWIISQLGFGCLVNFNHSHGYGAMAILIISMGHNLFHNAGKITTKSKT